MNNILEVRELSKNYGAFTLNGVTFDVPRGFIMGFIGPNGAGKTTAIKLILGVIQGDSGSVKLFGDENANAKNQKIGVVMDAPLYVDDWAVRDVEAAVSPFYPNWNAAGFAGYLKRFGLEAKKKVKELSRGMKVKLQIAVALSHDAQLLILDEPTSGLDPVARDEICDLLREFVTDENKSVFFSTHITSDLEKTADYITFILGGNIVFTGTKDALTEKYCRVTGGLDDIDGEQKKFVTGYREHGTGFEGMAETANVEKLPSAVLSEPITLDEIIIFMCREAKVND
ncbi:MAG: ABC transporter ATP-binding protein [Clostridiales bacterium]|jgi:ABC-2 type transport system ATP-binding protein|nr:ABC transporter ATP-binding protein [Clostridiales bacterium]